MLNEQGFDLWADGFDVSVQSSEEANAYPFAGYKDVLNAVYRTVHTKGVARVLDIGFGTGVLTQRLYDESYEIYGVDFSSRMIEIAQAKMPCAHLYQYDFSEGLPPALDGLQFDFIISTYALHHLSDPQKVTFLELLRDHLAKDGRILIGDVAFESRNLLEACQRQAGEGWDSDEIYIVHDELASYYPDGDLCFQAFSHCAGVIELGSRVTR